MKDLARGTLVLSPQRAGRGWLLWCALVVAALLAGAAGSHWYWSQRLARSQQQSIAVKDVQQLEQAQEQSRLQLRVAEGRSQELERQIDALNQRLRESQEELTFFRKARDAKRQTPTPGVGDHVRETKQAPRHRGDQAVEPDR